MHRTGAQDAWRSLRRFALRSPVKRRSANRSSRELGRLLLALKQRLSRPPLRLSAGNLHRLGRTLRAEAIATPSRRRDQDDQRSTELERNPAGGGPMATRVAHAEGQRGPTVGFLAATRYEPLTRQPGANSELVAV
jgi:hypothetical protein